MNKSVLRVIVLHYEAATLGIELMYPIHKLIIDFYIPIQHFDIILTGDCEKLQPRVLVRDLFPIQKALDTHETSLALSSEQSDATFEFLSTCKWCY